MPEDKATNPYDLNAGRAFNDAAASLRDSLVRENVTDVATEAANQAHAKVAQSLADLAQKGQAITAEFKGWPGLPADKNLRTLGAVCRTFYVLPSTVREVAATLGIEPSVMIDDSPIFSTDSVIAIGEELLRRKRQAENSAPATSRQKQKASK